MKEGKIVMKKEYNYNQVPTYPPLPVTNKVIVFTFVHNEVYLKFNFIITY